MFVFCATCTTDSLQTSVLVFVEATRYNALATVGWLASRPSICILDRKGATFASKCAVVTHMESFDFGELFAFLQTALGMILSFLAGRRSMKRNEKNRPSRKDCGFSADKTVE